MCLTFSAAFQAAPPSQTLSFLVIVSIQAKRSLLVGEQQTNLFKYITAPTSTVPASPHRSYNFAHWASIDVCCCHNPTLLDQKVTSTNEFNVLDNVEYNGSLAGRCSLALPCLAPHYIRRQKNCIKIERKKYGMSFGSVGMSVTSIWYVIWQVRGRQRGSSVFFFGKQPTGRQEAHMRMVEIGFQEFDWVFRYSIMVRYGHEIETGVGSCYIAFSLPVVS